MGGQEVKEGHAVKTDCFAYRIKILDGKQVGACDALKMLYCREEKCSFYKPKTESK